jgi:predicted PurR-regulated permease PerM
MRMKWVAAIAITASLAFSAFVLIDNTVLRIILAAVGVFALWFVFSRPTRVPESAVSPPEEGSAAEGGEGGVQPPLTA